MVISTRANGRSGTLTMGSRTISRFRRRTTALRPTCSTAPRLLAHPFSHGRLVPLRRAPQVHGRPGMSSFALCLVLRLACLRLPCFCETFLLPRASHAPTPSARPRLLAKLTRWRDSGWHPLYSDAGGSPGQVDARRGPVFGHLSLKSQARVATAPEK